MLTRVRTFLNFPVVGIGASAGGLAAFEAFFTGMPENKLPDMAFVLIQHLSPEHDSQLAELIKHYTKMAVYEVQDGMMLEPNCIYVIPSNKKVGMLNGNLQLFEIDTPRGHSMPIDFFFKSLAIDQQDKAVCIVLSGNGSDGSLGLRAIKGEGGIAIAQRVESAEYAGMPFSAIETGLVDFELLPGDMMAHLTSYADNIKQVSDHLIDSNTTDKENFHKKIFMLIRNQSGHDFSKYKSSMINRRIEYNVHACQDTKLNFLVMNSFREFYAAA